MNDRPSPDNPAYDSQRSKRAVPGAYRAGVTGSGDGRSAYTIDLNLQLRCPRQKLQPRLAPSLDSNSCHKPCHGGVVDQARRLRISGFRVRAGCAIRVLQWATP